MNGELNKAKYYKEQLVNRMKEIKANAELELELCGFNYDSEKAKQSLIAICMADETIAMCNKMF